MKVDPVEIYSFRVYFLACCACFGGLLFGMDTGIIGGVLTLPSFEGLFGLDPKKDPTTSANLSANIVTVMQAGAFAGALIAIPVADGYGRKPGLYMVSVFTIIGVIFQAASSGELAVMYIGRCANGINQPRRCSVS
jgi:MFS family permease